MTEGEAAVLIVNEAREILQSDLGVQVNWEDKTETSLVCKFHFALSSGLLLNCFICKSYCTVFYPKTITQGLICDVEIRTEMQIWFNLSSLLFIVL